ncbi:SPFH domain-containing protein [Herbidospora sp. NEAU-GS84]|uniref:SPFH domain-containing protein n=1 Tax=Herbidospora solisilvae TaxID=2696284 RepID=A0A7C9IZT4_9ACTN|nr:SPFH domain-containing protein [Herbidospora solisilvae]NAS20127.1 SPFH domain-containing protein [Herbidospora solisilvae]
MAKTLIGVLAVALTGLTLITYATGFTHTDAGVVTVIRDGGPFDDSGIRQILNPATGPTWTGFMSTAHAYPAQQRIYTITSDPKRATTLGVDEVVVPSGDGVNVGVEGTFYFSLNLDHETIKAFDDRYGTRTYVGDGDDMLYAWDGDEGWSAFFSQAVRPVIYNTLRVQIGAMRCEELVPTCAFLNGADLPEPNAGLANLAKVQSGVNASLEREIQAMLGGPYLTGFRFNLVRITLPDEVQQSITSAQGAQADIRQAEARAEKAKIDGRALVTGAEAEAEANRARQKGYEACPACVEIDKIGALPDGITVYAPGNPQGVDAGGK